MNSCPKCGSITVIQVNGKQSQCGNPPCKYRGLTMSFKGLHGTPNARDPYKDVHKESIIGGRHTLPIKYDDFPD